MFFIDDTRKEVLLSDTSGIMSQFEKVRTIIAAEQTSRKRKAVGTMHRSSEDNVYVNVYSSPQYYWEKCFPTLYPYGRGGPSDMFFRLKDMQTYFKHILRRGGGQDGRRFQNNPAHMFVCYTFETRRRVGSVAYAATKDETATTTKELTSQELMSTLVECFSQSPEDEAIQLEPLFDRVQQEKSEEHTKAPEGQSSSASVRDGTGEGIEINKLETLQKLEKLLQRIVPYAKQLPGTQMHMRYERLNMLSMLTSSAIVTKAHWRWFLTWAFPDKFDSRTFENLIPMGGDIPEWMEREDVVSKMECSTRAKLLRDHPAIVARMFHEKQECIWKWILLGSDHPVGWIEDYIRRVEVRCVVPFILLSVFMVY